MYSTRDISRNIYRSGQASLRLAPNHARANNNNNYNYHYYNYIEVTSKYSYANRHQIMYNMIIIAQKEIHIENSIYIAAVERKLTDNHRYRCGCLRTSWSTTLSGADFTRWALSVLSSFSPHSALTECSKLSSNNKVLPSTHARLSPATVNFHWHGWVVGTLTWWVDYDISHTHIFIHKTSKARLYKS